MDLRTIGYEGSSIDDFIETLRRTRVEVLIDVRDIPISRKPGFSKRALAARLKSVEIEYVHLRALGDPKPGREAARRGDHALFERIFRKHLASDEAQLALEQAISIASERTVCLLCFERDHRSCHRSIVAEEMATRLEYSAQHTGVRTGIAEEPDQHGVGDYAVGQI